jgi:hypothetical protein
MELKTNKNSTKGLRKEIRNQKNEDQIEKKIYHKSELRDEI